MVIPLSETSGCNYVLILMARLGKLGPVKIELVHGLRFPGGRYRMAISFLRTHEPGANFRGI